MTGLHGAPAPATPGTVARDKDTWRELVGARFPTVLVLTVQMNPLKSIKPVILDPAVLLVVSVLAIEQKNSLFVESEDGF